MLHGHISHEQDKSFKLYRKENFTKTYLLLKSFSVILWHLGLGGIARSGVRLWLILWETAELRVLKSPQPHPRSHSPSFAKWCSPFPKTILIVSYLFNVIFHLGIVPKDNWCVCLSSTTLLFIWPIQRIYCLKVFWWGKRLASQRNSPSKVYCVRYKELPSTIMDQGPFYFRKSAIMVVRYRYLSNRWFVQGNITKTGHTCILLWQAWIGL